MPISQPYRFKCDECGYTEVRTIGDHLPDMKMMEPCPKCGEWMKMGDVMDDYDAEESGGFLGKISDRVGRIFE